LQSFETLVKKEKAHADSIWSVAWRNKYIVTGSVDGHVKAWSPDQLDLKNDFYGSPLAVVSVVSTGSGITYDINNYFIFFQKLTSF